jgi:signal transduction histidine kinase
MKIPFFHRLYVRLWLAVLLAVIVMALLMGWLLRQQAERIRGERLAEVPAREVVIRDTQGQRVGQTLVQPVRVPGRGIEFHIQLPEGVKGGEQLAISLPPRPRPGAQGASHSRELNWWSMMGAGERGAPPSLGFVALLIAFALAVALGSYPVVRRLTMRLEGLQRGVERLGAGDLRSRVDESGHDEAAFLARRFNRAADQIEALVQAQKSLLANASHELRSPLARIRMGLELMAHAPSAALKEELSRSISELDALIDEILLASRLEAQSSASGAGAQQALREPVDLLALAAEEGARVGIPLDWQGKDAQAALLYGDARLLRRMLRNLLENAQRHGGQDVTLLLTADAQALILEVSDRGPGVPLAERERIFEPFYRSHTASESSGGVGLGLSLVRSIARQHGASVQCLGREGEAKAQAAQASSALTGTNNAGARFVVRLPLHKAL